MDLAGVPDYAVFALFLLAAGAVLGCGTVLTRIADRFADISGMGEAVTGAIMLGAITSIAGCVTSVSAAATGHADLAISNAVGGIAAQTVFLVLADLAYRRANLEHAAASVSNMISGTLLVVLLSLVLIASSLPPMTLWMIHPVTPLLLLIYAGGMHVAREAREAPMWKPSQTKETVEDKPTEPRGDARTILGQLGKMLGLGLVVGLTGWLIAVSGLEIASRTGLREGLVGALMTSVVTSTPELVTTVAAVRRGALTLAIGGILGGNTFDVLFIAFSDMSYRQGSIYHAVQPDQQFLILLTILMTAILLLGLLRRERRGLGNIGLETLALLFVYTTGIGLFVLVF